MDDSATLGAPTRVATVCILFFGKVADVFGRSLVIDVPADGCSAASLRARLSELADGGREALGGRGVRFAVDQQIAGDAAWVRPGQEVALFSMFSGG